MIAGVSRPTGAPMRAVILADFAVPSGGAQKVALDSARALAEASLDVAYVHAIGREGDPIVDHPAIERIGLGLSDIWERPPAGAILAGLWNCEAAEAVKRVLAGMASEPDVVLHLHQ